VGAENVRVDKSNP